MAIGYWLLADGYWLMAMSNDKNYSDERTKYKNSNTKPFPKWAWDSIHILMAMVWPQRSDYLK